MLLEENFNKNILTPTIYKYRYNYIDFLSFKLLEWEFKLRLNCNVIPLILQPIKMKGRILRTVWNVYAYPSNTFHLRLAKYIYFIRQIYC